MLKDEPVSIIMSTDVKTVQIGQGLSEVRLRLNDHSIHHVPVLQGDRLVGIVSALDMMKLSFDAHDADGGSNTHPLDQHFHICDAMQSDVVCIDPRESIRHAAEILSEGLFHCLPVVQGDRQLVGIVTSTDLIQYLYEQY